jgi:origin recognition complex subunit 1
MLLHVLVWLFPGKTATVHRVLSELSLERGLGNFEYVEINGMRLPEPAQLYTALWKALTTKQASPAKACQYLRTRFESKAQGRASNRPVCVLLVDELDYLLTRQQEVLYNLFDWPTYPGARLVVLGISNVRVLMPTMRGYMRMIRALTIYLV